MYFQDRLYTSFDDGAQPHEPDSQQSEPEAERPPGYYLDHSSSESEIAPEDSQETTPSSQESWEQIPIANYKINVANRVIDMTRHHFQKPKGTKKKQPRINAMTSAEGIADLEEREKKRKEKEEKDGLAELRKAKKQNIEYLMKAHNLGKKEAEKRFLEMEQSIIAQQGQAEENALAES